MGKAAGEDGEVVEGKGEVGAKANGGGDVKGGVGEGESDDGGGRRADAEEKDVGGRGVWMGE